MCLEVAPRGQMPLRRSFSDNLSHQGEIGLPRKAHTLQGDYATERSRILGNPSVDAVMDEID